MNSTARKLLVLPCILFLSQIAFTATQSDGTAALSGVVKGGSGANLAVHLEPTPQSPVRYYDGYEALPREDGSFTFTEIPPGKYRLSVAEGVVTPIDFATPPLIVTTPLLPKYRDRSQYGVAMTNLSTDLASDEITLLPSERRKGFVITLTHNLSFCGHVTRDAAPTDAWGRKTGPPNIVPADTNITFYHYNSEFRVLDNKTQFDTNKDGSFHVTDLTPGTYYVRSNETWYPGVASYDKAEPVVVTAQPARDCKVEIQLVPTNSCTTGEVFGEIKSDPAVDKNQYDVVFFNRNHEGVDLPGIYGVIAGFRKMEAHGSGENYLTQICSGDYDVVLSEKRQAGTNLWDSAPTPKIVFDTEHVSLTPNGAAHVALTPHSMASIEGEVLLDKVTKNDFCPQCQSIYVSILREGSGEFQTVNLSSENHFNFYNVTPGEYQIFVTAKRLDKVFLKSILVDGIEGKGSHFTISEPKFASMKVTLSGDLSQAAGHASPDVRHGNRWQTEGMRPLASVSGQIDGEGGAIYTLRLLPIGNRFDADGALTTQSQADGSFRFDNVLPGIYRLRAHDKNYLRFDYGAKAEELRGEPLLIAPGETVNNLVLKTPIYNSICGHYTDDKGYSRTTTIYYRSTSERNRSQQTSQLTTDNDGYFRIDNLLAGDYFIQIPTSTRIITLLSNGQTDALTPIHIEDGQNPGCGASQPLEFQLPANIQSTYSISGSVSGDLSARIGDRFLVELVDETAQGIYGNKYSGKLDAGHKFNLENVPDGRYRLNIYGVYGPEPQLNSGRGIVFMSPPYVEPLLHLIATQLVEVRGHDISGIALKPLTLPSITGVVHIQHPRADWTNVKLGDLSVRLIPHRRNGSLSSSLTSKTDDQAEFSIGAADAGEYEVAFDATKPGHGTPRGLYVQTIKLNGKEVNPRFFSLPQNDTAQLEIVLSGDSASAHVSVHPDTSFALPATALNKQCGPSTSYTVVLFPDPPVNPLIDSEPEQVPHFYFTSSYGPDCVGVPTGFQQNPAGMIMDIQPGGYYAIATLGFDLDYSQFRGWTGRQGKTSPEQVRLLRALEAIAKPVTLHAAETLELELPEKTIDASRIAARVGVTDETENLRPQNGQSCCGR
jgi:hypothetical protein